MHTVDLCGQQLPAIGMGSWRLGQGRHARQQEADALRFGLSQGIRVIDTAEMYGEGESETLIGEALRGIREQAWLVSKVYPWNASRGAMQKACEDSLRRLQTEYLDLYLLHWSSEHPLDEIIEGFGRLKAQGKIGAWGVSNFDTRAMQQLWQTPGGDQCAVNQIFYNPAARGVEYSLLPWCEEHGVTLMGYSPLGGHGSELLDDPVVRALADHYQTGSADILLRWAIRQGNMLVIPESGSVEHTAINAAALTGELTDNDLQLLERRFPAPQRETPLEIR
ncbi:aldo/keto reductase [Tatumella ptyseos]|uniref:aldo/keto reductase n=1 Tax=Tatumella ptyseos TaxID=82987 RepID=UPI0023F508B2|nr:aldo/keto reductase [Tatumella ptyseos]